MQTGSTRIRHTTTRTTSGQKYDTNDSDKLILHSHKHRCVCVSTLSACVEKDTGVVAVYVAVVQDEWDAVQLSHLRKRKSKIFKKNQVKMLLCMDSGKNFKTKAALMFVLTINRLNIFMINQIVQKIVKNAHHIFSQSLK